MAFPILEGCLAPPEGLSRAAVGLYRSSFGPAEWVAMCHVSFLRNMHRLASSAIFELLKVDPAGTKHVQH